MRHGECIGVLALVRKRWAASAAGDRAGAVVRDQATIAIENARLFRETQDALDVRTAIAEVLW